MIGLASVILGVILSLCIYIYCKYKNIEEIKVHQNLFKFYAFISFLQSVAWIKFSSGFIVDLLRISGFIIRILP